MKPQTKPIKIAAAVPSLIRTNWTMAPHAWSGRCPECGSVAVFRETQTGRVAGAWCAPGSWKCWWAV